MHNYSNAQRTNAQLPQETIPFSILDMYNNPTAPCLRESTLQVTWKSLDACYVTSSEAGNLASIVLILFIHV